MSTPAVHAASSMGWPFFDEVLDRWLRRRALDKPTFDALSDSLKAQAFTSARLAGTRAIEAAHRSIAAALEDGKTLREWRDDHWEDLAARFGRPGANHPAYMDMLFRTTTQNAYASGHYAEMFRPDWVEAAPFWQYNAIDDGRTRPQHRALDGKVFRKDDPYARRYLPPLGVNCVPGDTLVRGVFDGGSRALYTGDLVKLTTARGNHLTVTRNHPVATSRGLVPAYEIREGDDLICHNGSVEDRLDPVRAGEAVRSVFRANEPRFAPNREHVQYRPAKISETFQTLRLMGDVLRAPPRADDFYGEGSALNNDVEVVTLNGELLDDPKPSATKFGCNGSLPAMHEAKPFVSRLRTLLHRLGRILPPTGSLPRLRALPLNSSGRRLDVAPLEARRQAAATGRDPGFRQTPPDNIPRDSDGIGDGLLGLSGLVALDKVVDIHVEAVVRCPVFDLQSRHGWILAGNIYISNCRCGTIELTEEDVESSGYSVANGSDMFGEVGLPPRGWDTDRVSALVDPVLQARFMGPPVPEITERIIRAYEDEIRDIKTHEEGILFDQYGLMEWRGGSATSDPFQLPLPADVDATGKIFTHNHPGGRPLTVWKKGGGGDVVAALQHQLAQVRACRGSATDVVTIPRPAPEFDLDVVIMPELALFGAAGRLPKNLGTELRFALVNGLLETYLEAVCRALGLSYQKV